jgi:saccharopepsin
LIIDIPLESAKSGSVSFSHNTSTLLDDVWWLPSASHIELDNVGIRKGGMITMPVTKALLSLGTPYISLPDGLFYILLQAANTSSKQKFVVNCEAVLVLPDLVFGLAVDEDGDEDSKPEEIVVTPQQYVMAGENGKCMLLARSAGEGPIEMGWAAIRGRKFVLNLAAGRMGFGLGL